ncbi:uncharacterized protein K460DRAFT_41191 [Cucurbitaria berberidis CBS 394.84]|uniref:Uncharacterized protein n=1 Tax=Cucurbitaria berberidis CBS 394.84 TaxID=1168544 RepID=A0A9P4GTZ5_9PLEO|nr:uncharacterized protein K460DRAFT_41191 [Cucurbitaria berberidis CBS 394.84]KAF1851777.1 hypothetical protein K460DRAFT_41191 [Cucurbitaria berberidis CBS 394.84]
MPSSPSTASTQQAARPPTQLRDLEKYRQTIYHNDAGHHIAESRRRSRVVRRVEPAPTAYCDWILYPTTNATSSSRIHLVDASPHPTSSASSSRNTSLATHVTTAKPSSNVRPKAVIVIEEQQSVETGRNRKQPPLQTSVVLTPPPTPRMDRLPTPDFLDLDEAPFCDCGVEAHIVKFCTSCNMASSFSQRRLG